MKPTLAFIDHSFHQKTRASSFLIEILKKEYAVDIFWDEAWNKGPRVDLKKISEAGYNLIVFFQVFQYPAEAIKVLKENRVILFPMFDACPVSSDFYWKNFTCIPDVRFINFSKTLHERMIKFGFTSKYFRYFLPVDETPRQKADSGELKGFFWQRTDRITWDQVKVLIKNASFEKFNIHSAIDPPGFKFIQPGEEEIKKYNIDITKWFTGREDYLRVVRDANVFFAPRVKEGIGMAFLEAMAMGKCVVAPDSPTMNEYITHGITGLLYNPQQPQPLDFSNIEEIGANTKDFFSQGYKDWQLSHDELLDFITEPLPEGTPAGTGKLKKRIILYFQYRKMINNLKVFIKKILPGTAKLFIRLKKAFLHNNDYIF